MNFLENLHAIHRFIPTKFGSTNAKHGVTDGFPVTMTLKASPLHNRGYADRRTPGQTEGRGGIDPNGVARQHSGALL